MAHAAENGGLKGFAGAAPIDIEDFWRLECEFLVPAALEGQLTVERAAGHGQGNFPLARAELGVPVVRGADELTLTVSFS